MLTAKCIGGTESQGKEHWNPTSREKRARYGAPVLCEETRAYQASLPLLKQGAPTDQPSPFDKLRAGSAELFGYTPEVKML